MSESAAETFACRRAALCGAVMAIATTKAGAATITDSAIVNQSSPNFAATSRFGDIPSQDREILTAATVRTETSTTGDEASFTSRMAWLSANHVYGVSPNPLPGFRNNVAYDPTFTAEDPTTSGHLVASDKVVRGDVTAQWTQTFGSLHPSVASARGAFMEAHLGSGNAPVQTKALNAPFAATALATNLALIANQLASDTGAFNAGSFFGTLTFVPPFSPTGAFAPDTETGLAVFNLGEEAVRFGIKPTLVGYTQALTPNPADGEPLDALGDFVIGSVK